MKSMRYNFEEEDGGRQSEDIEWLPLQHHPVFSTPPDRDRDRDSSTFTVPKNLLAWDGASRLYFWDSYKTCLHRLSVRLGEPDPTSLLAASPSKVNFLCRKLILLLINCLFPLHSMFTF